MLNRIIYYALSIVLITTLVFVPLIFSYQHIIKSHLLNLDITFKNFQYIVSLLFILIILIYIKSLKN